MSNDHNWLEQIKTETTMLAEAYQLRLLGRLWWANVLLVVLPASFGTAAAILAASSGDGSKAMTSVAAWLAGGAAVLTAIHKSLKCEEYQAECLRLSQGYRSLAVLADFALSRPQTERDSLQKDISTKLDVLVQSEKAPLPKVYVRMAKAYLKSVAKEQSCAATPSA